MSMSRADALAALEPVDLSGASLSGLPLSQAVSLKRIADAEDRKAAALERIADTLDLQTLMGEKPRGNVAPPPPRPNPPPSRSRG